MGKVQSIPQQNNKKIEPFCFLGVGDCSSTASTTTTTSVSQELINESDLKSIQSMTTKHIMNTVNNAQDDCSANANNAQKINMQFGHITGGFNLSGVNTTQAQDIKFNLSCIANNTTENSMADDISQAVQQEIANKFSTEAQAQIASKAQAAVKSGFLNTSFLSPPKTSTNTNTKVKIQSKNLINTTLENIVNNTIEQNFNTHDIESCSSSLEHDQNFHVGAEYVGGSVDISDINIAQELRSDFQQKCVQESKTINNVLGKIQTTFDTISKGAAKAGDDTVVQTKASSTTTAKGIGSFFKDLFSGAWLFIIIIGIVIIVGLVLAYKFSQSDAGQKLIASKMKGGGDTQLVRAIRTLQQNAGFA